MRSFNLLIAALLCASCGAPWLPPSDRHNQDQEDCKPACATLEKLGCEAWTPDCVAMCKHALEEGIKTVNPRCVKTSTTCEQAESCNR